MQKIPQSAELHDLPHYWQRKVRQYRDEAARYRVECRELRQQVEEMTLALEAASPRV
jgi:hypothetical protein